MDWTQAHCSIDPRCTRYTPSICRNRSTMTISPQCRFPSPELIYSAYSARPAFEFRYSFLRVQVNVSQGFPEVASPGSDPSSHRVFV